MLAQVMIRDNADDKVDEQNIENKLEKVVVEEPSIPL
jgi:hypothetical protein